MEIVIFCRTRGNSRIWLASKSNSSKLLEYRRTSSGTVMRFQCRRSRYSTCLLHAGNKGIHLNIFMSPLLVLVAAAPSCPFSSPSRLLLADGDGDSSCRHCTAATVYAQLVDTDTHKPHPLKNKPLPTK